MTDWSKVRTSADEYRETIPASLARAIIGLCIGEGEMQRFAVRDVRVIPREDTDPGFICYSLSPAQAVQIITSLWRLLPLEDRPVPGHP